MNKIGDIVRCSKCKRKIVDGMIYYHHPKKGFICEYCPGFEKGGIEVVESK